MFSKAAIAAIAAATVAQAAAPLGFNYANKNPDGSASTYQNFVDQFKAAQALAGAPDTFNAGRLYTMLDAKDGTSLIPALQAAIDTKTYLLLGMWASGDASGFDKEMSGLKQAISSMPDLAQYILAISVGSEDLYRESSIALSKPNPLPGQSPDTMVKYIKSVKDALQGSSWSNVKVGHVDTWNAWVNGTNAEVIDNCDFLGIDTYPYFETDHADNSIEQGAPLFQEAMDKTVGVAKGKEIWITETGWPVTGPKAGQAEANKENAKAYWDAVGCPNFDSVPTFWYMMYEGISDSATPDFSIADSSYKPLFDLSCKDVSSMNSTSSSSSSNGTSTASGSMTTGTGSASSGSGSTNGTYTSGSPSSPSGSAGSGSGSSSGSSGSGSGSSSGSGAGSSSASGAQPSGSGVATSGASTLSFSLGSVVALAAAAIAFL